MDLLIAALTSYRRINKMNIGARVFLLSAIPLALVFHPATAETIGRTSSSEAVHSSALDLLYQLVDFDARDGMPLTQYIRSLKEVDAESIEYVSIRCSIMYFMMAAGLKKSKWPGAHKLYIESMDRGHQLVQAATGASADVGDNLQRTIHIMEKDLGPMYASMVHILMGSGDAPPLLESDIKSCSAFQGKR